MLRIEAVAPPSDHDSSPPAGWGMAPQLACLAQCCLLWLLHASSGADANVFTGFVAAPAEAVASPAHELAHKPSRPRITLPGPAALANDAATKPVVATVGAGPDSVVAPVAPPPRYVSVASDATKVARLWRQRAARAASGGDYAAADSMYAQAMALASGDAALRRQLAGERSYWLRRGGRGHAARQALLSAGVGQ